MPLGPKEERPSPKAPSSRVADSCACDDVRKLGHELQLHNWKVQDDKRKMIFLCKLS
jgi:hypothetical protein